MTQIPHLDFLRAIIGINPHPFDTNLRTVEDPSVYIGRSSRVDRIVVHPRRRAGEYVRRWQDPADTTDSLKFEQTVTKSMTDGVERIEEL